MTVLFDHILGYVNNLAAQNCRGQHPYPITIAQNPPRYFTKPVNAKRGRLDHGAIGLQIHDKNTRVEFKDLRLKRLPSASQSEEPVSVGLQEQLLVDDYVIAIAEKGSVTRELGQVIQQILSFRGAQLISCSLPVAWA